MFGEEVCGKCGCKNLRYQVRSVPDGKKSSFEYFELVCSDCWAKLSYGQSDDGALFPVRYQREGKEYVRDENGNKVRKGTNGWVKFSKETGREE